MAEGERIATLDVAPEVLPDFAPLIGRFLKVVGTADCEHAVRLKVLVPAEFGPRVRVLVSKSRAGIVVELESVE